MLETLRVCPATGDTELSVGFKKDSQWFAEYLPSTNSMYIMHANSSIPVHLFVDTCSMGAGAIAGCQAYHTAVPTNIINAQYLICLLEVMNTIAAIQTWAPQFHGKLVHLYCDNATAVAIFQAGHSKDSCIQACARQLWFTCTTYYMTLAVGHYLESNAPHQQMHTGQHYEDCVNYLVQERDIKLVEIPCDAFQLSRSL